MRERLLMDDDKKNKDKLDEDGLKVFDPDPMMVFPDKTRKSNAQLKIFNPEEPVAGINDPHEESARLRSALKDALERVRISNAEAIIARVANANQVRDKLKEHLVADGNGRDVLGSYIFNNFLFAADPKQKSNLNSPKIFNFIISEALALGIIQIGMEPKVLYDKLSQRIEDLNTPAERQRVFTSIQDEQSLAQ